MSKNFIVLAMADGQMLANPMMVIAESHDDAHEQALTDLAKKLAALPEGAVLHSFDLDTDVTMLGEPPAAENPEPEADNAEKDGAKCVCPADGECRHRDCIGRCGLLTGQSEPVSDDFNHTEAHNEPEAYRPGELLFAVVLDDQCGLTVCLTTKECWEKDRCQSDDLGGHNVDNAALHAAGLCEAELMESVFECLPGLHRNINCVKIKMIEAGFDYLQEFQDFIDRQGGEE